MGVNVIECSVDSFDVNSNVQHSSKQYRDNIQSQRTMSELKCRLEMFMIVQMRHTK